MLDGLVGEAEIEPQFSHSLLEDLNTPAAIAALHMLRNDRKLLELRSCLRFLGFSCQRDKIARQQPFSNFSSFDSGANVAIQAKRRLDQSILAAQTGVVNTPLPLTIEANSPKLLKTPINKARIDELISIRAAARARKDFKESDRIRDELAAMGVVIKDSKEGTTWEIAR